MDKTKFIELTKESAIKAMKEHKLLASLQIAQLILESNWGDSELFKEANNGFGIKGEYKGESYTVTTNEEVKGEMVPVEAKFRKYPSLEACVDDRVNILLTKKLNKNEYRYRNLVGVTDYKKACELIQKDGYATDSKYAEKLIKIIKQYKLYEIDNDVLEISVKLKNAEENSSKNVIEVPKAPSTEELYRIRKSPDAADSQKGAFKKLDLAIAECDKYFDYKVYNSRGELLHTSTAKDPSKKETKISEISMIQGKMLDLLNTPLYVSSVSAVKARNITGKIYVYDGIKFAGRRYRICAKREYVGAGSNYVIGYIDLDNAIIKE